MTKKQTQALNLTKGDEKQIPCSKCIGKTSHKVLLSIDQTGEEHDGDWDYYWDTNYQIVQCQGCKTISFRKSSSNSEDCYQISDTEYDRCVHEELYPSRIEGRKGLENELHYLPPTVQKIYSETLHALNSKSPILAGIGLRALVETVCQEKTATGENLLKRIDDLVSKQVLTPNGAGILHKIRTLGNEAAHKVKPHSEKQLGIAMDVVEHLLTDVYILPKQVKEELD